MRKTDSVGQDAYRMDEEDWYEELAEHPGYVEQSEQGIEARDQATFGRHHGSFPGTNREEWIAHRILKRTASHLCARTLFGTPDRGWTPHMVAEGVSDAPNHDPAAMHHERREVELTEPRVPLGKTAGEGWNTTEYGYTGHDHRVNTETGYLSGGESTGVVIADRPTEEFLAIVELVIASRTLRASVAGEVRALAREQKETGNARDVDILRDVLARIETAERGTGH